MYSLVSLCIVLNRTMKLQLVDHVPQLRDVEDTLTDNVFS